MSETFDEFVESARVKLLNAIDQGTFRSDLNLVIQWAYKNGYDNHRTERVSDNACGMSGCPRSTAED